MTSRTVSVVVYIQSSKLFMTSGYKIDDKKDNIPSSSLSKFFDNLCFSQPFLSNMPSCKKNFLRLFLPPLLPSTTVKTLTKTFYYELVWTFTITEYKRNYKEQTCLSAVQANFLRVFPLASFWPHMDCTREKSFWLQLQIIST